MKLLLVLAAVIFAAKAWDYRSLGCWRDHSNRAIAGGIRFRGSVRACYNYAKRHGYSVFAVQYGGECFTAKNAAQTYKKYKKAGNCKNGKGGGWANDVYEVYDHHAHMRRLHAAMIRHRLKIRNMRVAMHHLKRWRAAAAATKRSFRAYNARYSKAYALVRANANAQRKMAAIANANARKANYYRGRYVAYLKKYKAVAANCAKSRAKWAKLTNAQVKAQRVYLARNRSARRSAAVYHRRYVAYLRLLKARSKQRSAVYKRYATYVRNANAWAKRYNAVARG